MAPFREVPAVEGDDAEVAVQEHVDCLVSVPETTGLLVEIPDPLCGDEICPPRRADIGSLPLRAHETEPFEAAERAVHRACVAVAVVHRAQPGGKFVAVVRLLAQEQQQAWLKEVSGFERSHWREHVLIGGGGRRRHWG